MEDQKIIEKLKQFVKEGKEIERDLEKAPTGHYGSFRAMEINRALEPKGEKWKLSVTNLLGLRFGKDNEYLKGFNDAINTKYDPVCLILCKENVGRATGVIEAVLDAMESGLTEDLFYQREVLVLGDLLDQAYEFLRSGFDQAATIYGRAVLETVVKEFANKNDIKSSGFDQTIIALKKANLIIPAFEHSLRANYAIGSTATHNQQDFSKITKPEIKSFLDFIRDKVLTM